MSEETETPNPPIDPNAAELADAKAQLAETAKLMLSEVPEHLRGLIPERLSPADLIAWVAQAKASGAFDRPVVPSTDGGARPAITPQTPDHSSLPVHARLAAGYAK